MGLRERIFGWEKRKMETYVIVWSPEGRVIAEVQANSVKDAKKKTPKPYSRFRGEVYAQLKSDREKEMQRITSLRNDS